jgi:7,8-dihydropterin-6-yl-methyl-4-(beta-D-ribofuranosyl)aminobenzene 5'-phosphate synthase
MSGVRMKKLLRGLVVAVVAIVLAGLAVPVVQLQIGKRRVAGEIARTGVPRKLPPFGVVKRLSVLPLSDLEAESPALKTEPGVAYLIKADNLNILFDAGRNGAGEHPSPVLHNMRALGVDPAVIDMLFFSHPHGDHTGTGLGTATEFSLSRGPAPLGPIPAYAPAPLTPSQWNPKPWVDLVRGPRALGNGIASIGPIPRQLFLLGYTAEQALAVNLEGKGVVLFVGCGHQGVRQIVERAQQLFDEPIYGIVGGLHLPARGGRPLLAAVGADRLPWPGMAERDVDQAIEEIARVGPAVVALSPHDSSNWTIGRFKAAFGDRYREIKVGRELSL